MSDSTAELDDTKRAYEIAGQSGEVVGALGWDYIVDYEAYDDTIRTQGISSGITSGEFHEIRDAAERTFDITAHGEPGDSGGPCYTDAFCNWFMIGSMNGGPLGGGSPTTHTHFSAYESRFGIFIERVVVKKV